MRFHKIILLIVFLAFSLSVVPAMAETEDEIVSRYFKKIEKEHVRKLGWISFNYSMNRINRHNDYNDFATLETNNFNNGTVNWLSQANSFGFDAGIVFNEKFAWSLGGEYWLKMGQNESGSYSYTPPGGLQTAVSDLKSTIKVSGFHTGLQYYFKGNPNVDYGLNQVALRGGFTVGYYKSTWEVWDGYDQYNLTTGTMATSTDSFEGSAPSFSVGLGFDYPMNIMGLSLGVDASYLNLNFTNVAWYNSVDQEIVASKDGTEDGRIDLNFSGVRGKVEVKKFFTW